MKLYTVEYENDDGIVWLDERVFTSRDDAIAVCRTNGGTVLELALDAPLDHLESEMKTKYGGKRCFRVTWDEVSVTERVEEVEGKIPMQKDYLGVRLYGGRVTTVESMMFAEDEQSAIDVFKERYKAWVENGSNVRKANGNWYVAAER